MEWQAPGEEEARLLEQLAACRQQARRRRRSAHLTFLAAGGAIGTCLYLARTRLTTFVRTEKVPVFLLFIAMTVALFVWATRLERAARELEMRAEELEMRLARTQNRAR